MKPWLYLLFVGLTIPPVFGQLNESDTLPVQLKFTATGSYLDGMVNRLLLVNRAELAYAKPAWGVSSRIDYQYGKAFYKRTENDIIAYNFLYQHPLRRLYPYVMLLVETNYRRKISFRYQPGVGFSYNLLNQKLKLLKVSLTGSFEHSAYGGSQFEPDQPRGASLRVVETVRLTGRVFGRHRLIDQKLQLYYEVWFQQSVLDVRNYRFHTDDALEIPLNRHLALRLGLRYSYEQIRLAGNKPYDLFVTYGFSIANF